MQNQITKKLIFLMIVVSIIFLIGCTKVDEENNKKGDQDNEILTDPEKECERVGGEWIVFSNGCVDSCLKERSKEPVACTQALTPGCDCGPLACWNGKTCEPNYPIENLPSDKESCESKNGKWGIHGLAPVESCILPRSDAGEECRDSSECEGECVLEKMPENLEEDQEVIGKCSEWNPLYGCYTFVENGKVSGAMCID